MPPYEGPLLTARALARSYGPLAVLRGVDLEIGAGDVLLVAGANGAGKTTLLRLLAGLARPTAGEVRVMGRIIRPADATARRPLGLVSHQSLLYDDLTLRENLRFAARLYGLPRPDQLALDALGAADLSSRAAATPRQLSRGLLQRAAIARALLHDPSVLLLDEAFTGLDAAGCARLRDIIAARSAAGCGAIVVTHQPADVWELATHVAILHGGRWAAMEARQGSVAEFASRHAELTHA